MESIYLTYLVGFLLLLGLFYVGIHFSTKKGFETPNSSGTRPAEWNPTRKMRGDNGLDLAAPLHNGRKLPDDAKKYFEARLNKRGLGRN